MQQNELPEKQLEFKVQQLSNKLCNEGRAISIARLNHGLDFAVEYTRQTHQNF